MDSCSVTRLKSRCSRPPTGNFVKNFMMRSKRKLACLVLEAATTNFIKYDTSVLQLSSNGWASLLKATTTAVRAYLQKAHLRRSTAPESKKRCLKTTSKCLRSTQGQAKESLHLLIKNSTTSTQILSVESTAMSLNADWIFLDFSCCRTNSNLKRFRALWSWRKVS